MISLTFTTFALLYVAGGLLVVSGLWFYYDRRDGLIYQRERSESLFHCLKCGRLYSAPRNQRTVACPGCSFQNSKLKF